MGNISTLEILIYLMGKFSNIRENGPITVGLKYKTKSIQVSLGKDESIESMIKKIKNAFEVTSPHEETCITKEGDALKINKN
jgi:hypothetical protein